MIVVGHSLSTLQAQKKIEAEEALAAAEAQAELERITATQGWFKGTREPISHVVTPQEAPAWWQCSACCRTSSAKVAPNIEQEEIPLEERPGCCGCMCGIAKQICYHSYFEPIFMSLIAVNVVVLMMEFDDMPESYEEVRRTADKLFTDAVAHVLDARCSS